MKKNLLTLLAIILSCYFSMGQVTTTSFVIDNLGKDAAIDDWVPNRANPNEIEYNTCAWTISGTPVIWRDFFSFDLSCIPPNAIVNSAELSLFYATTNGYGNAPQSSLTSSNESVLQRVTANWYEDSVTWNNQPATTTVDEVILAQSTSPTQDYLNINVMNMVQFMVSNPNQNYGFGLKLTNETYYARMIFASGDNPVASKHPKLVVKYTLPEAGCFTLWIDQNGDDGAIDDWVPGRANPNEIEYNTCAWTINGDPVIWRDFFKFNLPCDLDPAYIQSANLNLYYAAQNNYGNAPQSSLSSSNESVLQRVTAPWTETTVNWTNQPATTTTDEVILPQSTSANQDYLNINVTNMVKDMFLIQNNGFLLKLTNENYYARLIFASGDNPDATKHPALQICYARPTGISENNNPYGVKIYPNPFSNLLQISTEENLSHADFALYNSIGQIVFEEHSLSGMSFTLSLPDLAQGVYYYKLKAGEKSTVHGKLEKL